MAAKAGVFPADGPVRAMVLPMGGDYAVVPSAMLAEVVTRSTLTVRPDAPGWVRGSITWRTREVPVVSLGRAALERVVEADAGQRKLAILFALSGTTALPAYAVECDAVPRPVLASEASTRLTSTSSEGRPFSKLSVRIDGEAAFVPDLDALETAMLEGAQSWMRFAAADGPGRSVAGSD